MKRFWFTTLTACAVACTQPVDDIPDGGPHKIGIVTEPPCDRYPPDPLPYVKREAQRIMKPERLSVDRQPGPTVDIRMYMFHEEPDPDNPGEMRSNHYWRSLSPGVVINPNFLVVGGRNNCDTIFTELSRESWGDPEAPAHTYPIRGVQAVAGEAIDDFAHPSDLRVPLRRLNYAMIGDFCVWDLEPDHPFVAAHLPWDDERLESGDMFRVEHYSQQQTSETDDPYCAMNHNFYKLNVRFLRGCHDDPLQACFGQDGSLEPLALGRPGSPMYRYSWALPILMGIVDEGGYGDLPWLQSGTAPGDREGHGTLLQVGPLLTEEFLLRGP